MIKLDKKYRTFLTLIPSILMLISYYTLYLLLFNQMLSSRVDNSSSYKSKLGGKWVIKAMYAVGLLLILGAVAMDLSWLVIGLVDSEFLDTFKLILISTIGGVTLWFVVSIFIVYMR